MHGMHGMCRRMSGRECPAILVGTEKGRNTGGEMASPYPLPHCRCSSSHLHLPGPGRGGEGCWALADESATGHVHGSGFPCEGGQSPRHVKSGSKRTKGLLQQTAGLPPELVGVIFMPQRATSVGNKTRSRSPQ